MVRSLELANEIVGTIGDAREQTYVRDLVYGLHRIFDVALTILHAGMQGVEHVNKQMKLILVLHNAQLRIMGAGISKAIHCWVM
jgi:hypothetical protein